MFDASPALSKNGLSLYFTSNRSDGFGANDIWVSQRNSEEESWGLPINLGPVINTAVGEAQASLSRDGHWLFFASNRPGGLGGVDIWMSYREHVHDDFDWQPAINAGPGNSSGNEADPSFFQNDDGGAPQLFFASNRSGALGGGDFYVSDLLPDGTFGPAAPIPELNSSALETAISVRFDGLEVFFTSSRSGGFGGVDLWAATRDTVFDPWSAPTNLGPLVNSVAQEDEPDIASDRETLYFRSNRVGGIGGQDLYVTTRTKQKAKGASR
jgi:Tol biopolymer transport system component